MKKLKLFALGLMGASTLFLTSCEEDDDSTALGPVLTVTESTVGISGGAISAAPGSTLQFEWDARKGDVNLSTFSITVNGVEVSATTDNGNVLPYSVGIGEKTNYTDGISFTPQAPGTYVFKATDKDGLSKSVSVMVSVTASLGTEVTGAFFHIEGLGTGAWDLVGDQAMSSSDPDSDKDMMNTDMAGVTFTGSWEAGTGNGSMFVLAAGFDYAAATEQSAMDAFNAGTASASVSNPADGEIYIAKVRGTDYMVIKIVDVDPTDMTSGGGNDGKITFDYKKN